MSRKVLLTGAAGFVGHHVLYHILQNTDWYITCLDRLDTSGTLSRVADVLAQGPGAWGNRVNLVWHDLRAPINDLVARKIGDIDTVYHLAAGSHVDRSIEYPMEFVMDNVVGTCNLLDYARDLQNLKLFLYFSTDEVFGPAPQGVKYKEWDRYNSGNPYAASKAGAEELCLSYANTYGMPISISHCHDEETTCWTESGFKSVTDLQLGELVWTLRDNKELTLEPILEIVHEDYDGNMIGFKSSKYDLLVTPNHRMLAKKRGNNNFKIITANKLQEETKGYTRYYLPLTGEWNAKSIAETINVNKWLSKTYHPNTKPIATNYNTKDILLFVGWYLSEGSQNGSGTISIAQCPQTHPENCKQIIDLIKRLGFVAKQFGRNIQFSSVMFADFLDQFGQGSQNKKIPRWILDLDKEHLGVLFKSLMNGDGSVHQTYRRYYTKSIHLAEQVAEIAIKLGYSSAIKTRYTFNFNKNIKNKSYYVSIRNAVGGLEEKHIYTEEYNGKIWCIRTKSGNFFVKRNGEISCSGNTMNVFGIRQHPEKYIPLVINRCWLGEKVFIHANKDKTKAGQRHYINTEDVADGILFLTEHAKKGEKYNLVGEREVDNLELAQMIADVLKKPLHYELVDFHSSRPGHDLRYALDGSKMAEMGWVPKKKVNERLAEVVAWSLKNPYWVGLS